MRRANSLKKTLILGKIESRMRRGWQRMEWLDGIIDSMNMSLSKLQEIVKDREVPRSSLSRVQGYPQEGRRWRMKKDIKIKNDTGWPSFSERGPFTLFFSGLLYPELYIQQGEKCSQLNIPSVITFINIRFLLVRVLFSVHHLLYRRPVDIPWPLFDKCWSARTIIFL